MGIFGSRKKTQVGTTVSRVIDDDSLPDAVRTGAMRSILEGDGQLVENSMEELIGSLAVRIRRMYNYGKTQYIHGLPSGTTQTNLMGEDTIVSALESQVGAGIEILYYRFGPANLVHLGWIVLGRDYGYDSADNSFMVNGQKVFLSDMQPVVAEASLEELENGSLDLWGSAPNTGPTPERKLASSIFFAARPSPFLVDPAASTDYLKLSYCWEAEETVTVAGVEIQRKVLHKAERDLSLTGFDLAADYHQVCYLKDGKVRYWAYQAGSGQIPAVEQIFQTAPRATGTFFPFAYFRYDKKDMSIDPTTPEFKSTTKLLKTINMDFADVAEAINESPDIADVEQAMLMLAVPARSEDPAEQRYLFDFFENLYEDSKMRGAATESPTDWDIREKLRIPNARTSIVIQDKKFKMSLGWQTIAKRRVAGTIGPIGTHTATTNIDSDTKKGVTLLGMELEWTTNVPTHIYRRQITENIFDEILVTNLKMNYHIWGDYSTTGDENDDILLVPLDYSIIESYPMPVRERLAARSLHIIFNSRIVTKLKWYQTGIFKVILVIVAIVITVVTYGATIKSVFAAVAAGASIGAVAMMVLVPLLKYLFVSLLVRLFVKVVGVRLAFIAAIVAALYGGYIAVEAGSISGAPWAKELLALSTNLTKNIGAELQGDFADLQADALDYQQEAKDKVAELERANALLNNGNLSHLVPMTIFGESPDDFYQRTVHSGNIGVVGIEAVSSFVDVKLMLPKLSETLGDLV